MDVVPNTPLLWVLRDHLGMTGTKFGCGLGLCGACTVHIDGVAARSCVTPISAVEGKKITTIEGIASTKVGAAVQAAWDKIDVPQCGYCQSRQVVAATALVTRNPDPSDAEIDTAREDAMIPFASQRGGGRDLATHLMNAYDNDLVAVDTKTEKALHLAFDKYRLMAVTREFARDHGLTLPAGYDKSRGVGQRSLADEARTLKTGLSADDHKQRITEAWRQSDYNRSFVHALADRGYILAAGRGGYCVVDLYGTPRRCPG